MTANPSPAANERWTFIRDVVVFQIKLLLDNLRDLVLMPVALAAAVIDLIYRGEREGALFYKVLRWGLHSEEVIDVYSAIAHHDPGRFKVSEAYTVDGVIAHLENVVTREVEKGGTAATIKTAMDRAIDQLHSETGSARDAVVRTAGKLRERLGREEDGP
jgi:hypothetical protein